MYDFFESPQSPMKQAAIILGEESLRARLLWCWNNYDVTTRAGPGSVLVTVEALAVGQERYQCSGLNDRHLSRVQGAPDPTPATLAHCFQSFQQP